MSGLSHEPPERPGRDPSDEHLCEVCEVRSSTTLTADSHPAGPNLVVCERCADPDPRDCARCGATFYLSTKGGAFTSVSISHHGQENVEDYAESICADCGGALDVFMAGASTEGVDR